MLSQCIAFFLEYLESNSCMVHIVSHDSKAQGKQLVQDNLLLHTRTAASVDKLKQYTYPVSNREKFI
jgi:hypothetical protein